MAAFKHWWEPEEQKPNEGIFSTLRALREDISVRNVNFKRYIESHMNRTINIGYGVGAMAFSPNYGTPVQGSGMTLGKAYKQATAEPQITLNSTESCVSTLASRIASQKPRAKFLTTISGPDVWDMHLKAEQLEKFVVGKWIKKKLYRIMTRVFIDMCVCGFGVLKVYQKDNDIEYERIFPPEFIIDERGALTSDPNMAYMVKSIPAEVLKHRYPGNDKEIDRAKGQVGNIDQKTGRTLTTDLVYVAEAWHLPSGKGAKDGRHVICIEEKTLFDETWKREKFPFVVFKYTQPVFGWYPPGLVEQQEPLQVQVNKLLRRIQAAMNIHSVSKTFIEKDSVPKKYLRNKTGDIVVVAKGAQMPKVHMPPSASTEIFKHVWTLNDKIFENSGVSQLSAGSKKPAGIESGRALRTLQDVETGRHALLNEEHDDGFMDIAELTVEEAKDIYSRTKSFKSTYPERQYAETIDWGDVDMDRDQYEMQIFPSSMLPSTPAGRLQTVEELIESGIVTIEEGKELLSFPDLDKYQSLDQAGMREIDRQIGIMLSKGEQQNPEPYLPLADGLRRVTNALLWSKYRGAPDSKLQLLINWIAAARELLAPPPATPIPTPGGGEALPPQEIGGQPGLPPVAPAPPPPGLPPGLPPGIPGQGGPPVV